VKTIYIYMYRTLKFFLISLFQLPLPLILFSTRPQSTDFRFSIRLNDTHRRHGGSTTIRFGIAAHSMAHDISSRRRRARIILSMVFFSHRPINPVTLFYICLHINYFRTYIHTHTNAMWKYNTLPVVYGLFISVVSNAVVLAVRARVSSRFMSGIVIGAKIDAVRGTPRWRSRERVPDSFHFSFNRIVAVVFVVNIVVLLCKYNINSDADKRFGNAIKNEKRRFFLFLPRFFTSDLSWTASDFCRPTQYIIYVPQCIFSIASLESTLIGRTTGKDGKRIA